MTLNLQAKDSFFIFDSHGMLIVRDDRSEIKRTRWQRLWDWILKRKFEPIFENLSHRDSIGMTVCAWIAYDKPLSLSASVWKCYNKKTHKLYRHPQHKELASRDHWSYFIIQSFLIDPYWIENNIRHYLAWPRTKMRGMNLWMKSLTGNKRAERAYYMIYIPGAIIGNGWLRICRWMGKIRSELDNNEWIFVETDTPDEYENTGLRLQRSRTIWQKLWAWVIFITIPAYPLHNRGWQLYVMPDSKRKERLKRILLKRVGKSNLMLRLLFEPNIIYNTTYWKSSCKLVTQQEVEAYPHLTGYRPGVYLDETCRRTIREMTSEESAYNSYEHDLVWWLWENK